MLALVDGDVLCYMACKSRWKSKVPVTADADGKMVTFKKLGPDGNMIPMTYTKEEDRAYLEDCWSNFKTMLKDVLESIYCDDYMMAVKGENNFRNMLFPEYKVHRHYDPTKQNAFVPILRQLAVAEDFAVEATGYEADDFLRMWAEECMSVGREYIICSIDKDLNCIPGLHRDLKKNITYEVSELDALKNYYVQLLRGDPTDNIQGIFGVGEVMARNLVSDCNTEDELKFTVMDMYHRVYKDDWKNQLLITGRMTHLLRHKEDFFSLNGWPEPK